MLESGDLEFLVDKAKNLNVWNAKESSIANETNSRYNPVKIFTDYLSDLSHLKGAAGVDFVFPTLRCSKNGLTVLNKPISYDSILKEFRDILTKCGYNGKEFSLHSPKNGAVSDASNSGLCTEEQLKRHGRWASNCMPSYYTKASLNKKLAVSRALSLNF